MKANDYEIHHEDSGDPTHIEYDADSEPDNDNEEEKEPVQ